MVCFWTMLIHFITSPQMPFSLKHWFLNGTLFKGADGHNTLTLLCDRLPNCANLTLLPQHQTGAPKENSSEDSPGFKLSPKPTNPGQWKRIMDFKRRARKTHIADVWLITIKLLKHITPAVNGWTIPSTCYTIGLSTRRSYSSLYSLSFQWL